MRKPLAAVLYNLIPNPLSWVPLLYLKDMRIENILQSEKAKWRASADEEKQRALETAVLLAEEQWRTEHQGKVSEAVKEALEVAQNSWKKERENAIGE